MRYYTLLLSLLFFSVCCSTNKNNSSVERKEKAPFEIVKAIRQPWVGGVEGVSGINYTLEVNVNTSSALEFTELCIGNIKLPIDKKIEGTKTVLYAYENTNTRKEPMVSSKGTEHSVKENTEKEKETKEASLFYHFQGKQASVVIEKWTKGDSMPNFP